MKNKKTYTQNQRSTDHMFYIYLFWSDLDLKIEFPNYLSLGKRKKKKKKELTCGNSQGKPYHHLVKS